MKTTAPETRSHQRWLVRHERPVEVVLVTIRPRQGPPPSAHANCRWAIANRKLCSRRASTSTSSRWSNGGPSFFFHPGCLKRFRCLRWSYGLMFFCMSVSTSINKYGLVSWCNWGQLANHCEDCRMVWRFCEECQHALPEGVYGLMCLKRYDLWSYFTFPYFRMVCRFASCYVPTHTSVGVIIRSWKAAMAHRVLAQPRAAFSTRWRTDSFL